MNISGSERGTLGAAAGAGARAEPDGASGAGVAEAEVLAGAILVVVVVVERGDESKNDVGVGFLLLVSLRLVFSTRLGEDPGPGLSWLTFLLYEFGILYSSVRIRGSKSAKCDG
jgi:hypothetical protein